MTRLKLSLTLTDQRGVALPMALLALLVLLALVVGFTVLSTTEPVIATNQLRVAQARALAEAGLERAIWALNNPTDPQGIPTPLAGTAAAPYDGSQLIMVSVNGTTVGGFRVTVTSGAAPNQRNVTADGWVPNDTANVRAKQRITATVSQFLFVGSPPPSALTVRGEIGASGHSNIDSRSDTSCGPRPGSWSEGFTTIGGSARVYGADGNNTPNQGTDAVQYVPDASFNPYTFSNADLNALKAQAKKNGTYYQGTVTFNASFQMPNGIIYVDTVSGNNIDVNGPTTTPMSDFASVDIHGNAPADPSGIFSGLIFVAGSLSISGNFQMHGLVYAQNDFTYTGTGTGQIDGAVISQNNRDTSATTIDTNTGGNASIYWNCAYAKNAGGQVPRGSTSCPAPTRKSPASAAREPTGRCCPSAPLYLARRRPIPSRAYPDRSFQVPGST